MTRHRVVLPGEHRIIVAYGYDPAGLGFFLTVVRAAKRVVDYDALQAGYDGLPGLIRAMQTAGVFDVGTVQAALDVLVDGDVDEIQDDAVRAVAEMVSNLKREAGE